MAKVDRSSGTRKKLLDAALTVVRTKGLSATTVDDICKAAGVTKGGFFHHFASKDDLAIAATDHFAEMARGFFEAAPYRTLPDPLDRLLGYVDFRIAILQGALPEYTCLLGTMVQEAYETNPKVRAACDRHMSDHAAAVMKDVDLARSKYAPDADWTADSLAFFTQAAIQGSFIFAKAKLGPAIARESLAHLRRYIELVFGRRGSDEHAESVHPDPQVSGPGI